MAFRHSINHFFSITLLVKDTSHRVKVIRHLSDHLGLGKRGEVTALVTCALVNWYVLIWPDRQHSSADGVILTRAQLLLSEASSGFSGYEYLMTTGMTHMHKHTAEEDTSSPRYIQFQDFPRAFTHSWSFLSKCHLGRITYFLLCIHKQMFTQQSISALWIDFTAMLCLCIF